MPKSDHRQIPTAATHMAAGPFQFATASEDKTEGVPVSMRLRGLDAINHWYWGRIVHDMAGLSIHKDRLPVDYCHDPGQILGYLDKFETAEGLTVSGRIFPADDQQADKVHRMHSRGVPYESSMDWADPDTLLEWIPEGATTAVNGQQFSGPGYVVRKWSLRGAAICPYGADKYATTNFSAGDTVGLTLFSEGDLPMPKTASTDAAGIERRTLTTNAPAQDTEGQAAQTPPAETPAETPVPEAPAPETPETPAEPTAEDARKAEGQKFKQAFGDELGARFFADGLTWADAQGQFNTHMRDQVAQLTEQTAEKDKTIAALRDQLGVAPVSSTPEGGKPATEATADDSNLARFSRGIKLPTTSAN